MHLCAHQPARFSLLALVMLFIAVVPQVLHFQADSQDKSAATPAILIHGANIFDGQQLRPAADVLIADGHIQAVATKLQALAGVKEVDAAGDTLLPGLIDAHTHPWGSALQQALLFGVTTELSMFSDIKFDADVRQREAQGKNLDAADLRSSGTLVTVANGHGTEYGLPIPTLTNAAEAQAFVDSRIAEGSDYIKIIYDDGSAYGLHKPTLTKEELRAVIAAAHTRHRLTMVHIGSQAGARGAIEAGADGLAHTFEDEPPTPDTSDQGSTALHPPAKTPVC
jgi:hypothetical protein